jgi:hypothetical protein
MRRPAHALLLMLSACLGNVDDTVHTSAPPSSAKEITKLTLDGVDATITATGIAVTLPYGTDVTHLTATIEITGASVTPASGTTLDFTLPQTFTVKAANGTTKAWVATVTVAPASSKDITRFVVNGVDGNISGVSILVILPSGTDVTSLSPQIVHTGASISPASGAAQSFTNPVQYTVTAADGSSKAYVATVHVAASSSKDITSFSINGVSGTISGTAIALTLPAGTDPSGLTPSIVHTGASINPANGTPQSFSGPVSYTVTAADGSTKTWVVTVTIPVVAPPIDLSTAIITDGSAGDVASWPQTATLSAVNLIGNGTAISVDFDKKDGASRWADECDLPGFAPDCLQYTIWVFEYVNGQWYGTGAIEMWYGRGDTGENPAGGSLGAQIQQNWVYYSGAMSGHVLASGDRIGFMVTTGDERRKSNVDFQERSNVVMLTLP